jgi:hypothetical protein
MLGVPQSQFLHGGKEKNSLTTPEIQIYLGSYMDIFLG